MQIEIKTTNIHKTEMYEYIVHIVLTNETKN